jgi:hypothetical protein
MAQQALAPRKDRVVLKGDVLVGKILDKRYVVLEPVGPDGSGFRYVVYDMNSMRRVGIRVDPDEEGNLSGKTFVLVADDTPLAPAPALTPRVDTPASSATPPVAASVPGTDLAARGVDSTAPRAPLRVVRTPPSAGATDPAAGGPTAAPSHRAVVEAESPAKHDSTQPFDLASAEEIREDAPAAAPPAEPAVRKRIQTKVLEAAWFALGEQLEGEAQGGADGEAEAEAQPGPTIPRELSTPHEELERHAQVLSRDAYRRFALDLSPPAPPPAATGTPEVAKKIAPPETVGENQRATAPIGATSSSSGATASAAVAQKPAPPLVAPPPGGPTTSPSASAPQPPGAAAPPSAPATVVPSILVPPPAFLVAPPQTAAPLLAVPPSIVPPGGAMPSVLPLSVLPLSVLPISVLPPLAVLPAGVPSNAPSAASPEPVSMPAAAPPPLSAGPPALPAATSSLPVELPRAYPVPATADSSPVLSGARLLGQRVIHMALGSRLGTFILGLLLGGIVSSVMGHVVSPRSRPTNAVAPPRAETKAARVPASASVPATPASAAPARGPAPASQRPSDPAPPEQATPNQADPDQTPSDGAAPECELDKAGSPAAAEAAAAARKHQVWMDSMLARARKAARAHQWKKARRFASQVLSLQPDNAPATEIKTQAENRMRRR